MMSAGYYVIDSLLLLSIYCQYVLLINEQESIFDITFTPKNTDTKTVDRAGFEPALSTTVRGSHRGF